MASAMLWLRHTSDTYGVVGLAINACDERANGFRAQTDQIRELLVATQDLWELASRSDDDLAPPRAARRLQARPPRRRSRRHERHCVGRPGRAGLW